MTDDTKPERWFSPTGVSVGWMVGVGLLGLAFGAGGAYGASQAFSSRTSDRFITVNHRMDELSKAIEEHSKDDRDFTIREISRLYDQLTDLQRSQNKVNDTLGSIQISLASVQANLQFALPPRPRGDAR